MAAELKRRYLRIVRRAYRLLRSPRMKKHPYLAAIVAPIFNRELWHPCRETVTSGLGIGLFVAMLPIPGQMILAALGAMKMRANVPTAITACWVTNPITQLPIMLFQERFGDFLRESMYIPIHPILEKIKIPLGFIPGMEGESLNGGSFILGFLSFGFLLFLLAFPLVYLLSALMPRLLPKTRYQRAKAKVIARQKKEGTQNQAR